MHSTHIYPPEMSSSIVEKIDSFSTRITDLEGQIQDLMKDAGVGHAAGGDGGQKQPLLAAAGAGPAEEEGAGESKG